MARQGRAPVLGAKTASAAKLLIHGDMASAGPLQYSLPQGPMRIDRTTGPPMPMLGSRQRRAPIDLDVHRQRQAEDASCAFRDAREAYLGARSSNLAKNFCSEDTEGGSAVEQAAGTSAERWADNSITAASAFRQAYDGRLAGMARNREGSDIFEGMRDMHPDSNQRALKANSKHPEAWQEAAASRFHEAKAARQLAITRSSSCAGKLFYDEQAVMPELTQKIGKGNHNDGDALEKLVAEARETRQLMRDRNRGGSEMSALISDSVPLPAAVAGT